MERETVSLGLALQVQACSVLQSGDVCVAVSAKGAGGGGGSSAWKTFTDVKLDNLGNGEKPDYYTAKAMVAMINKERALYMACPSSDCNKKVRFSILLAGLSISFHC